MQYLILSVLLTQDTRRQLLKLFLRLADLSNSILNENGKNNNDANNGNAIIIIVVEYRYYYYYYY